MLFPFLDEMVQIIDVMGVVLVGIYTILTSDTTVSYHLGVLDGNGKFDNAFNEGLFLDLDFVPGKFMIGAQLGNEGNLYLISADPATFDTLETHQYFVTKLRNELVWDLPMYDSPYQREAYSIFPNPTTTTLNINYNGPDAENFTYSVYDMLGRLIDKRTISLDRKHPMSLEVTDIASGQYIFELRDENNVQILLEPFIKVE